MAFRFSSRSLEKLHTVRPELQRVMVDALQRSTVDFGITEGIRSLERQRRLLAAGATHTLDSRHLTGEAVDVVAYLDGHIRWDWPLYMQIARAVAAASHELGIGVTWGGSWNSFPDGPHFELSARASTN